MGKGKPRHHPDKPQNNYGSFCPMCEEIPDKNGTRLHCEQFYSNMNDVRTCGGNRHNCVKVKYRRLASRSDIQKINRVGED